MFIILISALVPLTLVLIFKYLNKQHKPPIFGIYQQRNKSYCFKFIFLYVVLRVKQLIAHMKRLRDVETGQIGDGVIHIFQQDAKLEEMYYLGDMPLAVDAVYFNGMSKDGAAVICGLARRQKHFCDAFLYLKVEGEDVLLLPSLPDTYLQQNALEEREYSVQGIKISNFIPMRTWKLSYNGELKPRNDSDERLKVKLDLTWSAVWGPFNYDTQISPRSMASDMAREPWSRDYFKLLKKFHQTHYEQMGFLKGTVSINGKEQVLNMPCVRHHSFGPYKDWRNFHRYVNHFIFLENGDCLAVSSVSQPAVVSHLTIGYLCRKSDQIILPINSCDFQLYQHGEDQIPPKDYGFTFTAGRQLYAVRVKVKDEESFYIGKAREAKFYERWSAVEVNGIKGWACVEWHYNNVQAAKNTN